MSLMQEMIRERWQEKSEEENGESMENTENKHLQIYLEMLEATEEDPQLDQARKDLEASILRYNQTILNLSRSRRETKREDMEQDDKNRRLAHNALMSDLSILSRMYVKKKGVNLWRQKIDNGANNRDAIRIWATMIAPFVAKRSLEINEEGGIS